MTACFRDCSWVWQYLRAALYSCGRFAAGLTMVPRQAPVHQNARLSPDRS
jgi:hypothetical protein